MTTGKLVVRGPTGWNAAISSVSSPCRSSRTMSGKTPWRRFAFKEQATT